MQTYGKTKLLWGAALAVIVSGCADDGLDKVVVRGNIAFDGEPVPHGQIRFIPVQGTVGPVSGSVIKDGQYVAEGKGGVPVGTHRVEIYAYRPAGGRVAAVVQAEGGASEQYIPSKYNGQSTLQVEITDQSSSEPVDFQLEP